MKLNRFLRIAAGMVLIAFAVPASATLITATYKGTLNGGIDTVGAFGTPNMDLSGLSFTTIYSFDTAIGQYQVTDPQQNYRFGGAVYAGPSPSLGASLTINGATVLFDGNWFGEVYGDNFGSSSQLLYQANQNDGVTTAYAYNYLQDNSAMFPADINAAYSWNSSMGGSGYGYAESFDTISGGRGGRYWWVNMNPASLDVTITNVPEPGTFALMLAGCGMLGFVARRRRKSADTA